MATLQSEQSSRATTALTAKPAGRGPTPAEERRLVMVQGKREKLRRELEELEAME